jgi:predicted acetyltransferase
MARELERDVRQLREQAQTQVGRSSGRTVLRSALYHVTRGRIDRRPRYSTGQLPTLGTPWQDTVSGRYFGWRCRQANLNGGFAVAVEYIVCPYCQAGWVDKPYTVEEYQRRGLASAALKALRAEHPGLAWYTGSGHMRDAKAFWVAVGVGVPGSYEQRELCEHIARHGGVKPRWLLRRPR